MELILLLWVMLVTCVLCTGGMQLAMIVNCVFLLYTFFSF
jgi:hypothetical protein